ncbi:MerR family transcriptional regulator [Massilia sp. SM-13]|uniref:MerR family transcriptional regulator n=1 Tax=Pseudoduganella rhizocola TaxID=3382643 RepID=UPI0038B4B778
MSAVLSVGQLARLCGVSRAALLYYESLGLLSPQRSASGYRRYGEQDVRRAQQIRDYRATGLGMEAIGALLDEAPGPALLQDRLREIHAEIRRLREQQALLEQLLGQAGDGPMTVARWTALQHAAGVDDAAMQRWHALFEQQSPQAHEDFLRSLGVDEAGIARIRGWSRGISV